MKKNLKSIVAFSLISTNLFSFIPIYKNTYFSYAENFHSVERDIDDGAEFVEIARLSHEETQIILKNWSRINYLGTLAGVKCPASVLLTIISEGSSWSLEDADKGNGVIVKQLQYPNGCTFCGGSGGLIFLPR